MIDLLPIINACLNSISAILLVLGYRAIKRQDKAKHILCMKSAFCVSSVFLICYLFLHYFKGSTAFPDLGWIKTAYLVILIPHILLAAGMLPLIFLTFFHAYKENWEKHKKIARWTFPIWLYVSVTGVVIYLMIYQIAPFLIRQS
jgi:uncharacterized membrane protein YozB (DUF420 family)